MPLPDQQPAALVLVQVEQLDGHSFGLLSIWRFDRAERGASYGGGFQWRPFHIEADAQPSSIHTNTAPSRDRPALGERCVFPRGLFK